MYTFTELMGGEIDIFTMTTKTIRLAHILDFTLCISVVFIVNDLTGPHLRVDRSLVPRPLCLTLL